MPRLLTKKWIEVYGQSHGSYNINKQVRFKKSMQRSDLCDYTDACIVVKGTVTFQKENNRAIDGYDRLLILKNNVSFIKLISKINNVLIDNAELLDILMPMYNLIEDGKNYSRASMVLYGITKEIFQLILKQMLSLLNIRQGSGLVSRKTSFTSWGEGASLALVDHLFSDSVTKNMSYRVDVIHRPASHPIFSYWVG